MAAAMIKARHSRWAQSLFHRYIMRLMQHHFHAFHLLGEVPVWPDNAHLLVLPNHCSWWDGFFIHLLNTRVWHRRPYLMMLEEQLEQHRFFARLGVFSVRSDGFAAARQSLCYIRQVMAEQPPAEIFLALFPQGELRPDFIRPLGYKPGILWLVKQAESPVVVVQLAIRIEFLEQQRPDVFFEFGPLHRFERKAPDLERLEVEHGALLDRLGRRICAGERGALLLTGHASVSETWVRWRARLKGDRT
jgi:hypothetical protein